MILGLVAVLIGPGAMPELRLIPNDNRPKIEATQWAQDLDILNRALTTFHPGRLRYQTEAEYQARLAALSTYFGEPRSRAQGYLAFAQFLRGLKCGHSYPNFFNQAQEVKDDLFAGRNKLPFTFRWLGKKMVVTSRTAGLVPGDEVQRIDGVPVGAIQQTLMTVARADGSNDDKRRKWLELTGVDGLEAFDIYHPLFYPRTSSTIRLTLARGPLTVEAITIEDRVKMAPPEPAPDTAIWTSRRVRPDTTLLEMPSWALYNTKWDWKAWLKTFFQTLDTPNLIIDIRNNEGGNSVGREIVAHLTPTQLPSMRFQTRTQYKEAPVALRPYVSTWDNSFYNWGASARPRRDGTFDLVRFDEDQFPIQPRSPRYSGKVAVLMSATNSSATFDFLSTVKGTGLATLIGQRSGGNQRGINGGGFFFTVLPNSKIEVDVPLIGYFPAIPRPDEGIKPDIEVQPSIQAIAKGIDEELARALRLFGSGR